MDIEAVSVARRTISPSCGYTLIELLGTITILSIVLALAIPSFSRLIQANRLSTAFNTLSSSLAYARAESIKRRQPIVVCKGTPGTACNHSRTWQQGWIVFSDLNGDKQWNDDEPLLWTEAALPDTLTLSWNGFPTRNYTIFYPNGTASSNGTFIFCDARGSVAAKALILSKTGRIRYSTTMPDGDSLQCS